MNTKVANTVHYKTLKLKLAKTPFFRTFKCGKNYNGY